MQNNNAEKVIKYFPNTLTSLRIAAIPLIIVCFYVEQSLWSRRVCATIFLFASITDFFDGFFARKLKAQTKLGKVLDPLADKLLVGSTLILLVKFLDVCAIPCILILCREFMVSGIREFTPFKVSHGVQILSKIKTCLQMTAIFLLLLGSQGSKIQIMNELGIVAIWTAAVLTIITGVFYLFATNNVTYDE
ncbi:CDP-diacylglycerol--glycerol-3-phosphate 3-phosphatidyltransferase [Candidatus Sneabacter namystus]|uniref:CDP-diacylglycerol--glycerol-3-phosphate 3-phosphatidyltransferase n=1 Tax=Candidatus Sneabacter namystus TaxID=2601646 RepID=A0A5C0UIU5_9RICK|nr:CDP-diacylglycerol--glycerol-3-phosphate 3-phosphatidyltransferase [Candidatus Sneabacter namystus]QEK39433.1 CDP-diacylglycerol--glycerol-3-phosphate 3-phosphatidyltransferase [Candidatus Sneabacter namystus]